MEEPEWERIAAGTERLRVEGGYLYTRALTYSHGDAVSVAMVFVRDRKKDKRWSNVDKILERIYKDE